MPVLAEAIVIRVDAPGGLAEKLALEAEKREIRIFRGPGYSVEGWLGPRTVGAFLVEDGLRYGFLAHEESGPDGENNGAIECVARLVDDAIARESRVERIG